MCTLVRFIMDKVASLTNQALCNLMVHLRAHLLPHLLTHALTCTFIYFSQLIIALWRLQMCVLCVVSCYNTSSRNSGNINQLFCLCINCYYSKSKNHTPYIILHLLMCERKCNNIVQPLHTSLAQTLAKNISHISHFSFLITTKVHSTCNITSGVHLPLTASFL